MKLRDYLAAREESRPAFAARIGAHHVTVTHWCTGHLLPRPETMRRITAITEGAVTSDDMLDAWLERRAAPADAAAA